jgi:hypothetical protein
MASSPPLDAFPKAYGYQDPDVITLPQAYYPYHSNSREDRSHNEYTSGSNQPVSNAGSQEEQSTLPCFDND